MIDHGYPIRAVAKRTGMSPHLIRMWERRYTAVKPHRTETGRRLYTDDDIERLILLRRATREGESISQIAGLSLEQLRKLIPTAGKAASGEITEREDASVSQHLNLCLAAMKNMDPVGLEIRLLRASASLDQHTFLEKVLHPFLEITGDMWFDGRLSVAHEHLASSVIRSLLGEMYISNAQSGTEPLLLSASPQGQLHEFGALIVSVTAAAVGWRTLYLGPNLPAEDIAVAAMSRDARVIALSIVYPPDDPDLSLQLRRIRLLTNDQVRIIVGGRSASAYHGVLDEIGALQVSDLAELRQELNRFRGSHRLDTGQAD